MGKSKDAKKKQKHCAPSDKWIKENATSCGLGDNPLLQRASKKHPGSWNRGRIRSMLVPSYVYVLIDRRTGEAYKSKNREMPFYTSIAGVKVGLRNISAYTDVANFEVVQYELVRRASLDGSPITEEEKREMENG